MSAVPASKKAPLKLGVIGLSEGNGHPYSWSAIINGCHQEKIKETPYPAIYEYLSQVDLSKDRLKQARVSHIWTQSTDLSKHIADTCHIENIVTEAPQMIGEIDALLLARDDAETHLSMASPFLEAQLPVYIDKPLAYSTAQAKKIFAKQQYPGQIFSCSALKFANEFQTTLPQIEKEIGTVTEVVAHTLKSWNKYSIHIIDPLLKILQQTQLNKKSLQIQEKRHELQLTGNQKVSIKLVSSGSSTGAIKIYFKGSTGEKTIIFRDTYSAFRSALLSFIQSVENKSEVIPQKEVLDAIRIVEMGMKQ